MKVTGKGSGRVSLVGLIACKPGKPTRLIYRMIVHHGRRSDRKGFREKDFATLLDAAHQRLGGPMVVVWDNYTHHTDAKMRSLIAGRSWLIVHRFPTYAPELNPAEGIWAHCKRSIANLAPRTTDELARLIRSRLRHMQYRPALLDSFIAETGLITAPTQP